eukprot:m.59870 g.59870  ORF g.59870 m.59870 type:complete len:61 (-) comp22769_c0_seq1:1127-1309(-)
MATVQPGVCVRGCVYVCMCDTCVCVSVFHTHSPTLNHSLAHSQSFKQIREIYGCLNCRDS